MANLLQRLLKERSPLAREAVTEILRLEDENIKLQLEIDTLRRKLEAFECGYRVMYKTVQFMTEAAKRRQKEEPQ
jgi:regulator of replication initiation timing